MKLGMHLVVCLVVICLLLHLDQRWFDCETLFPLVAESRPCDYLLLAPISSKLRISVGCMSTQSFCFYGGWLGFYFGGLYLRKFSLELLDLGLEVGLLEIILLVDGVHLNITTTIDDYTNNRLSGVISKLNASADPQQPHSIERDSIWLAPHIESL